MDQRVLQLTTLHSYLHTLLYPHHLCLTTLQYVPMDLSITGRLSCLVVFSDTENTLYFCCQRTKLEKLLMALVVIFSISIVVMLITLVRKAELLKSQVELRASHKLQTVQSTNEVCLTADCIMAASRMLEAMDPTVDRCEDFYNYACGSWNKLHIIPSDRPSYDVIYQLTETLQTKLKVLFEERVNSFDPQAVKNVKYLYQSCLNTELIERRGEQPLRSLLAQLGGWPLLDNSSSVRVTHNLVELLSELRLVNNRILFAVWVSSDDRNSSLNVLHLDQPQLGLPSRDYYLKGDAEKAFVAYREMTYNLAVMLGANSTKLRDDIRDIVDFEVQLAKLKVPDEQRRDTEALYQPYTVEQLYDNLTDEIDWQLYFRLLFNDVGIPITMNEQIIVYAPSFIKQLGRLISETPHRTLVNYVIWQAVISRLTFLPQRFTDLRSNLKFALTGADQDRTRWRSCVNYVHENFGMAVGRMFVTRYFDERAKANALAMIAEIRAAFNELLAEVSWIDDKTRLVAREKAAAMSENIGYPDYILNDTILDKDYQDLRINADTFFENVQSILRISTQISLKQLRQPVDKIRWSTSPAIVNAFYSNTKNKIMFPAGILQPPFYHENYPKYLNYGGIGMIIGHEITHGFDDVGRQLDRDGNLKQWWSQEVISRFKTSAQCVIDQYSNFTIPQVNIKLNAQKTQGENIADNGGLKQAFRAYRHWVEEEGREEAVLPGLNMTSNQLFFLNFAQMWCGTARPESYIQYVRTNLHSPGRFRVIGTLSNSVDFATAFQCRPNSAMNPLEKCNVW